jgi:hypothetical protein
MGDIVRYYMGGGEPYFDLELDDGGISGPSEFAA